MLGGARNKPYSIQNYIMFILIARHCIGRFMLNNLGEALYFNYHDYGTDDKN